MLWPLIVCTQTKIMKMHQLTEKLLGWMDVRMDMIPQCKIKTQKCYLFNCFNSSEHPLSYFMI